MLRRVLYSSYVNTILFFFVIIIIVIWTEWNNRGANGKLYLCIYPDQNFATKWIKLENKLSFYSQLKSIKLNHSRQPIALVLTLVDHMCIVVCWMRSHADRHNILFHLFYSLTFKNHAFVTSLSLKPLSIECEEG